jgi:hypothetical protein
LADFAYAVANADYSSLAGGVEKTSTALIDYPTAFTADGYGIIFAEISGE